MTRTLFSAADEHVLRFLYEENQRIEPEWYCPIIPTVLINGAEGIGTGYSTKVPNYNPRDLAENMRRLIRNEPLLTLVTTILFITSNKLDLNSRLPGIKTSLDQ